MEYERITCADVKVGDRIAHAKTHKFLMVEHIDECSQTRRLHLTEWIGDWRETNIRPRRDTKLWREC